MRASEIRALGKSSNVIAIDFFCGAGGLTHGLERVGINVRLGVDIDPECEFPYTANNKAKFLLKSVKNLQAQDIAPYIKNNTIKLFAGCAPCQTFSTYNQKANSSDNRWGLLSEFSRIIREFSPELVTMENVPGLVRQKVFHDFVSELEQNQYLVDYKIVNCKEYGVPQNRQRLVVLASKLGPIQLLSPLDFGGTDKSVRNAIGSLPPIAAGETHKDDLLHKASSLSKINFQRIRASKPGGSWKDWDSNLVADCHKKATGKTYPSVYGRMNWDDPAPTMTTQFFGFGNGRFGHPEQDRAISLREGAILQSFPVDYLFSPPGEVARMKTVGRLVGNAVPVKLGELVGASVLHHLAEL